MGASWEHGDLSLNSTVGRSQRCYSWRPVLANCILPAQGRSKPGLFRSSTLFIHACVSPILFHVVLTIILGGNKYCFHFMDEETEPNRVRWFVHSLFLVLTILTRILSQPTHLSPPALWNKEEVLVLEHTVASCPWRRVAEWGGRRENITFLNSKTHIFLFTC